MYWSGERLWEGCGGVWKCRGGAEEWRREWGAMLRTSYIPSNGRVAVQQQMRSCYSLTLVKRPNTVASYVMIVGEERNMDGVYVSLSEGFCSSVV